MYINYIINDSDTFDQNHYDDVVVELTSLNKNIAHIESNAKSEIVISFLKDHCIQTDLLTGNKKLAETITSGFLKMHHTESLFQSCQGNKIFLKDFEAYVRMQVE
ncbi:MAG: hypothetical protein WA874_07120 [Chryseosolibacter sp.]